MKKTEYLALAQRYRDIHDLRRAFAIYREVIGNFPESEEAIFARHQLLAIQGARYSRGIIMLPFQLPGYRKRYGGFHQVQIGRQPLKILIPGGLQSGNILRLKKAGHYMDPMFEGKDIHLRLENDRSMEPRFTPASMERPIKVVHVDADLPVDFDSRYWGIRYLSIKGVRLEVNIPWGTRDGKEIILKNKAEVINGGLAGNIILRVVSVDRKRWRFPGIFKDRELWPDRFTLKFSLPYFFEIGGDWEFRESQATLYAENVVFRPE